MLFRAAEFCERQFLHFLNREVSEITKACFTRQDTSSKMQKSSHRFVNRLQSVCFFERYCTTKTYAIHFIHNSGIIVNVDENVSNNARISNRHDAALTFSRSFATASLYLSGTVSSAKFIL